MPPPRLVVAEGTTDLQAELRQVDAIRVRHASAAKPNAEWRVADVDEDDIYMEDMPAVTAVHYGLSPSETLEGDHFGDPRHNDDDDATLVLAQ